MHNGLRIAGSSAVVLAMAMLASAKPTLADPMLRDFAYPHPVKTFQLAAQNHDLTMAYMDVAPATPNGRTVVLLHGKNFCGATWESVVGAVTAAGYRAIIPDQIGFCKSDKPRDYHYGLHELASNTHALVSSLGIREPILVGHSMGGMLALRYALSFPDDTGPVALINPIGLEDWRAKGVPERTVAELFAAELKTDASRIKAYQQKVYYDGKWRPEYDRWVDMLASMYSGPGGETVAWAQALTSRMVFADPVVHEFGRIAVPVTLMVGEKDTTAIGRDRVPPDLARELGNYAVLSRDAAARIPGSTLVAFEDLGHSPHVEAPDRFNARLIEVLGNLRGAR